MLARAECECVVLRDRVSELEQHVASLEQLRQDDTRTIASLQSQLDDATCQLNAKTDALTRLTTQLLRPRDVSEPSIEPALHDEPTALPRAKGVYVAQRRPSRRVSESAIPTPAFNEGTDTPRSRQLPPQPSPRQHVRIVLYCIVLADLYLGLSLAASQSILIIAVVFSSCAAKAAALRV